MKENVIVGIKKDITMRDLATLINDSQEMIDLLVRLRERWMCEYEYEDILEYRDVIAKTIPNVYGITKRPFGIKCKCSDGNLKVDLKSSGNYIKINYSEIKK